MARTVAGRIGHRHQEAGNPLRRGPPGHQRDKGAAFEQILGRSAQQRLAERRETARRRFVAIPGAQAQFAVGQSDGVVAGERRKHFADEPGGVDQRQDMLGPVLVEAADLERA